MKLLFLLSIKFDFLSSLASWPKVETKGLFTPVSLLMSWFLSITEGLFLKASRFRASMFWGLKRFFIACVYLLSYWKLGFCLIEGPSEPILLCFLPGGFLTYGEWKLSYGLRGFGFYPFTCAEIAEIYAEEFLLWFYFEVLDSVCLVGEV